MAWFIEDDKPKKEPHNWLEIILTCTICDGAGLWPGFEDRTDHDKWCLCGGTGSMKVVPERKWIR